MRRVTPYILALVLLALLVPAQGWAALAVDTRGDSGAVNFGSSTITQSATVAASPLAVCVVWQGTETLSSVTWNGGSMGAAVGSGTSGAGVNFKAAALVLANPTSGTHDIVATFSGVPSGGSELFYVSTTGGNTTTGNRAATVQTDSVTGPGLTLANAQSGDLIVHCISAFYSGTPLAFDGSEDSTNTLTASNGSSGTWGMSTLTAAGGDMVGSNDQTAYVEIAVALIPSSVASTTRSLMMLGVGQ